MKAPLSSYARKEAFLKQYCNGAEHTEVPISSGYTRTTIDLFGKSVVIDHLKIAYVNVELCGAYGTCLCPA